MKLRPTALPGVLVIEPQVYRDQRGWFFEAYQQARYRERGMAPAFVQSNQSHSTRGVLRGMHYQLGRPQDKLVRVLAGTVLDVAVDVRRGSPTFGRWAAQELSGENLLQLYVPKGFAHGFYVTSDTADVEYLCSDYYAPQEERAIRWDDPTVAIAWPEGPRNIAPKDAQAPLLRDQPDLPAYGVP